jgi:hypothetical protein
MVTGDIAWGLWCDINWRMPPSKGLTRKILLRMTEEERDLVAKVQTLYGYHGVEMSMNDTVRHLIRRAGIVLASTVEESYGAIRTHCETCPHCELDVTPDREMDPKKFRCPEGLYLYRSYGRVWRAHAGAQPQDAL